LTIREAEDNDHPKLLDLWWSLTEAGTASDPRYRPREDARSTADRFIVQLWVGPQRTQRVWVAVGDDGDLVGFMATRTAEPHLVLASPPTLVITDAFVVESYRRRGVGRALVGTVRAFADRERIRAIEVGTLALDSRAVAFWRSLGFGDWRVLFRIET
jgi:GNAT superfamily N-acetyltransferase